jgi:hypothetical protein
LTIVANNSIITHDTNIIITMIMIMIIIINKSKIKIKNKINKTLFYVLQPHNHLHIVMRVPKGGFKWTGILFYERHPVRSANVLQ